ncbi:MAG: signal peptidase II [Paludibacteraceae bacterium]|nr:signal peptidase II [Paludibacteraceae bacterium]
MSLQTKRSLMVTLIVVLGVVLDQVVKLYVQGHFRLYEDLEVTSWFHLCYILNDGMAFGVEWFDKLALTLFRLVAIGALGWYLNLLIRKRPARTSYLVTVAFVMAGAIGNIVDCICYGPLFQHGQWFYGKVVDMLYFPLIRNSAGEVLFFQPVFNVADSYITCAVIIILLFFTKDLNKSLEKVEKD